MFNPAYLTCSRHNVFYFRWPLPKPLRPDGKPRHIKLSLRTRNPGEALHLARMLEYHAAFLIAQAGTGFMKHSEAKAIVEDYCRMVLAEHKRKISESGPLTTEQKAKYQNSIENGEFLADFADAGIGIADRASIERLLQTMGLTLQYGGADYNLIRDCYRQALPAFSREVLRYNQEHSTFDFSPEVRPAVSRTASTKAYKLDEICEKFVAAHEEEKRWEHNTRNEKRVHLKVLQEIVGSQLPISNMNKEQARNVRDIIKSIPKNKEKNKKTKGLPLKEAIKVTGVDKIAPATVSKYMETYISLFAWCVDEGYAEKNDFLSLRMRGEQNRGRSNRPPFKPEQVKTILAEVDKKRGGLANRDYRYWGTLIGIYTGARLNEIAQIELDDIKSEDGIWYFDMNDDGERKKLKTKAAQRRIPIHSELIKRGIIEYRDTLKKQGKVRLLHELTHCRKNGWGKKLGHFVNQVLLPKLDMKTEETVFHCFRHTANDALRNAQVELTVIQTIIGHERSGGASEIYFKNGYNLVILKQAIEKLLF